MSNLVFDPINHEYRYCGDLVPSVTRILAPLTDFSVVRSDVLEAASNFGKAVHSACELDDIDDLDEVTLHPEIVPYLIAWRDFCIENKVEWELIEEPLYHHIMRYAGTPDRFGIVNGKSAIVDIKTSSRLYKSVGPQLAAYEHALPGIPKEIDRIAVQLKGDGTYRVKHYSDPQDWDVFASLLTLQNWCVKHKVTPRPLTWKTW